MARPAWLVGKEVAAEDDKIVDLEEFLRSVLGLDDAPERGEQAVARTPAVLPPHDDIDDALDALDDEVLSEDPPPDEPGQRPLDVPLPPHSQPQLLVLDERSNEALREAPPIEPRPHELDERLDEALAETFPASDPIAVSTAQ